MDTTDTTTTVAEGWPPNWVGQLLDTYHTATGGFLPGGMVGKLIKPVQKHVAFAVLLTAWGKFVVSPDAKYGPGYFLRQMGQYAQTEPPKKVYRGVLSEADVRDLSR